MGHVRALDGFRGLAIIGVILFHYTWISCGWAGVQVFFVLSGFLITSILLTDRFLPPGVYFSRFYWRRSLRIFPLYFGYLAVLTAVFLISGGPAIFERYWPYLFTYTLNWRRVVPGFQDNRFFGHFWSLSVEEQFYLVWPALVYLLPRRAFQGLILVLLVLSPVIRAAAAVILSASSTDPGFLGEAIYSLTPGQLDAFAAGASVVVFREQLAKHEGRNFLVCSLILLAAGQVNAAVTTGSPAFDTSLGYSVNMFAGGQHIWGYTLIDLWAASLLALACKPNAIAAVLSWPALVYIGKISYGMYVFHPIMLRMTRNVLGVRHGLENLGAFALYFAAVMAVAALSYRWYEVLFLRMKDRHFGASSAVVQVAAER